MNTNNSINTPLPFTGANLANTLDYTGKTITNGTYLPMNIQLADSSFSLTNGGNNTQTAKFSASNLTTARTFTFPNVSGTLALTSSTVASVIGTANQLSTSTDSSGNCTISFGSNINIPTTVSIGSTTLNAQFQVNGGVQNITNEQSALRIASNLSSVTSVKFELDCTAASTGTGKVFELRSSSDGSWDLVNRTNSIECFKVNSDNSFQTYGKINTPRLVGSSPPTVTLGSAAGTGATCTINGSELGGIINLHTGTGTTTGTLGTFNFASAMSNLYYSFIIDAANPAAITAKTTLGVYMSNVSVSSCLMIDSITALAASTNYIFAYHIVGT